MAKSRKARVIDSYTAIRVAHDVAHAPSRPSASPRESADQPADLRKLGAHVGRTVVPAKRIIECYQCGYRFQQHGRTPTTPCSKCRVVLDLTDHTIDGKWNESLRTAGSVHLAARGVLESGDIVANDFVLEGRLEAGTVRALRRLELRPGAKFSETQIAARDLTVAAGAAITFTKPAEYRDVEVSGTLRSNLTASGTVTVHAGGLIEGELRGAHLVVEDGGGLCAAVRIGDA